jgi:membrane-associated protein
MSYADLLSPEKLIFLLDQYRAFAYPVLFIGAYLETLIPFSLVVFGEIFFIAGSVLAGIGKLNIWIVAAVLYIGGILGDNCSYWLGRRYGMTLFQTLAQQPLVGRFFGDEMMKKGVSFFRSKGDGAVFFARLCGPCSWVIPAFAGAFKQRYGRFIFFNTFGVIIGIGEFLVLGYLFGNNLGEIMGLIQRFGVIGPLVIFSFLLLYWFSRLKKRKFPRI